MKNSPNPLARAFTLVELLVVMAIIAILAALLVPAIYLIRVKAQVKAARLEMANIVAAIHTYEADCSKFPVSSNALNAASTSGQDFTYGTFGLPNGLATPSGSLPIQALDAAGAPLSYQANNSEVMAVLLDVEYWPNSPIPTINQSHVKNPHKTRYLNPTMSGNTTAPGVGTDGVYRDLWGQPYVISMDLNGDGKTRDAFYRGPSISADPGDSNTPKQGLNGLIPKVVGSQTFYEANSPVMVWSASPDKMVDNAPGTSANQGVNKDNVLSWK